jgi:cellulose synthase/poly-beta-1,6-N-acetylglucosamine synthase-like glycosyltransferase/peptidoglycan/xylan/chitin deacetylase (PgdA/CDA1 family)/spore germination protein YaaH
MKGKQVLSDPTGRRARVVNAIGLIGIIALCVSVAAVVSGFFVAPNLNAPSSAGVRAQPLVDGGERLFDPEFRSGFTALNKRNLPANAATAMRLGFVRIANSVAHTSLIEHAAELDGILPDFLELNRNGELHQKEKGLVKRLRIKLEEKSPSLKIFPILSNGQKSKALATQLADPDAATNLIAKISEYTDHNSDAGVTLIFDELDTTSHPQVFRFLAELKRVLNSAGRSLILIVGPGTGRSRIRECASVSDYIVVNLFRDADDGLPGPLASQRWFEANLASLQMTVDPAKLIIGVGSLGYDFGRPAHSRTISVPNAWGLMKTGGIRLKFDEKHLNPWFRFADATGVTHDVWFLDGVTVFNQLRAALVLRPAGIALSALGFEDPSVWATFGKGRLPDSEARLRLERPPRAFYFDPVDRKPEVVSVSYPDGETERRITYNERLGLILREAFQHLSGGKELNTWHPADKKAIALTFDDGPDEKVTGRILDILAAKSVKASFFVVGQNAIQNKDLLRRTYNEGHDIGNHSYTHPRLFELSQSEIRLELNRTQRALEAILGINSLLFRPPYGAEVDEPESLPVIEEASKLGYVTVATGVNSFDWIFPPPPAPQIIDAVVKQVSGGKGQILLFHDLGKKDTTIKVLPQIIDRLIAAGYHFVTVHELIGKSRNEVMPRTLAPDGFSDAVSTLRTSGLLSWASFVHGLGVVAIIWGLLSIGRFVFVVVASRRHLRKERERESWDFWPSVAVIVPAYNEEKVICKTVASVLAGPQKDLEVLVVDDGSKDRTAQVVREQFARDPRVRVFVKENGGKATAANFGLAQTRADVVVCIDADTVLAENAIPLLVRHFRDPKVGAVAGTAVVGNEVNLLTKFQAVEYMISQYLDRRAFALCNATGVVPGAIGAWRRDALLAAGGYSSDTLAEDGDATFSVTRAGWQIVYEPAAEARTEAPESLRGFLKQRHRWMFGTLQVVAKHRSALRKPTGLAFITIPNVLFSQFGFSLLIPVLDAVSIVEIISSLRGFFSTTDLEVAAVNFEIVAWWIIFQALYLFAVAGALTVVKIQSRLRLIWMLLLQRFLYAPLIYWVAVVSLVGAMKGHSFSWRKLVRTGNVTVKQALHEASPT